MTNDSSILNRPSQAAVLLHALRAMLAVAGLSIRAAVRSRVVAALLVLLAAGVIGIPHLVAGDGTPASELQVRLRYTLAFGVGVLGLATLWASCAAFAARLTDMRGAPGMEATWISSSGPSCTTSDQIRSLGVRTVSRTSRRIQSAWRSLRGRRAG